MISRSLSVLLRRPPALAAFLVLAIPPLLARADCIDDAAVRHGVNPYVLRAIGWQESRLQTSADGRNANGSTDHGAFQINSAHLPELARHGIDATALEDGCVCAEVAAWHYRRQIDRDGNTWTAVGAYHSRTPSRTAWYADRIAAILMSWSVMPPGPLPFGGRAAPPPRAGLASRPARVAPSARLTDPLPPGR